MTYALGRTSLANLSGVHPDLVRVVKRAIELTEQDFAVFEGLRSMDTQREYVKRGVSRTMNSKHLRQPDGTGHAVDLVPWIGNMPRWEWPAVYVLQAAVQAAAIETGVLLRWGGVWDRKLNLLQTGPEGLKAEVQAYNARHPGKDFNDGPHVELVL